MNGGGGREFFALCFPRTAQTGDLKAKNFKKSQGMILSPSIAAEIRE